jgi:hypothetical protein
MDELDARLRPGLRGRAAEVTPRLKITRIALTEAMAERQPEQQALEQHIRAQLQFQLSGAAADGELANQSACFVQLLAYEPSTGRTIVLAADRQLLTPDQQDYTVSAMFVMPDVGRYQLVGIVLLPDDGMVEVALGPSFRVTS